MKLRPTIERLREVLDYDPGTGLMFWRVTLSNRSVSDKRAGSFNISNGYVHVTVDGVQMLAHRVIWAIVIGKWPSQRIDHRDNEGFNNRWKNLRLATNSQNMANSKNRKNSSGFRGVIRHGKLWRASITIDGKRQMLGSFNTPEEAHSAWAAAAREAFGEFARAA